MVVEQKAVFDKGAKKLIFKNASKNSTFRRNKILMIVGGIVLIAFGILRLKDILLPGINKAFGFAAVVLGVALFGLLIATYIFLWRQVSKDSDSAKAVNCTYKLDETGLRTRTNIGRTDYSWDKLRMKEHQDYIEVIVDCIGSSIFLKKDKLKEKEIKWILAEKK